VNLQGDLGKNKSQQEACSEPLFFFQIAPKKKRDPLENYCHIAASISSLCAFESH
jgi:hypothetical protein